MSSQIPQQFRDAVAHLPVSVTIYQGAEALGVSPSTIVRAEARGEIRIMRTRGRGGRRLVLRDELARLLATWATPVARGA